MSQINGADNQISQMLKFIHSQREREREREKEKEFGHLQKSYSSKNAHFIINKFFLIILFRADIGKIQVFFFLLKFKKKKSQRN